MKLMVIGKESPASAWLEAIQPLPEDLEVTFCHSSEQASAKLQQPGEAYDWLWLVGNEGPETQDLLRHLQQTGSQALVSIVPPADHREEPTVKPKAVVLALERSPKSRRLLGCRLSPEREQGVLRPDWTDAELLFEYHAPCVGEKGVA